MSVLTRSFIALLFLAPSVLSVPAWPHSQSDGTSGLAAVASAELLAGGGGEQGGDIWGTIKRYTDGYVVVGNRTYHYAENVVIDTYSLEEDERGNVRLILDEKGRVTHLFFYGIDMPDAVRRYKM